MKITSTVGIYPLAWGNGGIKNFLKWKKKVKGFELMMTQSLPAADYDIKMLGEKQRDGYRACKIEAVLSPRFVTWGISVGRASRIWLHGLSTSDLGRNKFYPAFF